jgi:hypothetical protein
VGKGYWSKKWIDAKISQLSHCAWSLGLFGITGIIVAFLMESSLTLEVLSPLLEKSAGCGV